MAKDRIVLLDSLRGLAVLGIFLCNIPIAFAPEGVAMSLTLWPLGHDPASSAVWLTTQMFFQQKFYTMFSMLFGVSMLLVGGEGDDRDRTRILILRLVSMLAIGLFHGFVIWQGDVLHTYAIVGLVAMWARSWSPKRLLQAGIGLHVALSAWTAFKILQGAGKGMAGPPPQVMARFMAENQAAAAQYGGSFMQSLTQNAHDYADFVRGSFTTWPPSWPLLVLSLMLMGMGLYKLGVLTGKASDGVYRGLIGAGLGALAVVAMAEALYVILPDHAHPVRNLARWLQSATAPVVSLGYAGLMVMAARARVWRAIPAVLAPVGQMAFTNYLTQSILMTAIAYGGRGPGLYGKLDRPALAGIVVAIWTLQILWSHWWMARFTMGPLEWLWRLAYRGPMPLRRQPVTETALAA
ncbi:MAG: DUF418 domain-containing protein [Caulobacter sp.]|nr:DUF418 domain-containing protein [Caulobacter sp.]